MRVSGEGVHPLTSTLEVIGYFCLQQIALVGLQHIYHNVVRLHQFLHKETGKLFPDCSIV